MQIDMDLLRADSYYHVQFSGKTIPVIITYRELVGWFWIIDTNSDWFDKMDIDITLGRNGTSETKGECVQQIMNAIKRLYKTPDQGQVTEHA